MKSYGKMRESACSVWTRPETVSTTAALGAGRRRVEEKRVEKRRGEERVK